MTAAKKPDPESWENYLVSVEKLENKSDELEKRIDSMTASVDAVRGTLWKIFSSGFLVGGIWATFMYWHVNQIQESVDSAAAGVHALQVTTAEMNQKLAYHEKFAVEIGELEKRIRELENGSTP